MYGRIGVTGPAVLLSVRIPEPGNIYPPAVDFPVLLITFGEKIFLFQ